MKILFQNEKLKEILLNFYNFTHICITIMDVNYNTVAMYPNQMSDFCKIIRSDKERHKNCLLSDNCAFNECAKSKKSVTYVCHAGLSETATPILYENIIIGYIIFGQYKNTDDLAKQYQLSVNLKEKYQLDANLMYEMFQKTPYLTQSQIDSAKYILNICIAKFWLDELIKIDNDMLVTNIKLFIEKNIAEKITVQRLCEEFLITKKKLYEIFDGNFHKTVKQYVTDKKMEKAKQLLTHTDLSVSEIAENVGFSDYNNFIYSFRLINQDTPLKFRKKHKSHTDGTSVGANFYSELL